MQIKAKGRKESEFRELVEEKDKVKSLDRISWPSINTERKSKTRCTTILIVLRRPSFANNYMDFEKKFYR